MSWLPGDGQDIANFINYSIWRKITDLPPGAPELWHYIATENFVDGLDLYDRIVPTLIDANQDTVFHSTFMVTAHTDDPYVFFDSPPYSGYSIDNLSPEAPRDLSLSNSIIDNEIYQVDLSWSDPTVEDFAYHNVYRNNTNNEEGSYQVFGVPGIRAGLKYNFSNKFGVRMTLGFEELRAERIERSDDSGTLPDRARYYDGRIGFGLSKFF